MRESYPLSVLVGTLVVLLTRSGFSAEYATASLSTGGAQASSCASADALTAAVESRLERKPFVVHTRPDLFVNVDFDRHGAEWVATIELRANTGQSLGRRKIESQSSDCASINDSLALVLALMVDLTRTEVEARAPSRTSESSTEVHVPATGGQQRIWSPALTASLLSTVGQLPGVGWGGRVASQLQHHSGLGLEFGVAFVLPSIWNDGRGAQARFNWYAADLGLSTTLLRHTRGQVALCAGAQLNFERAEGSGYRVSRVQSLTSLSPFIKLESSYRFVASLGFYGAFSALAPLLRDRFYALRADGEQTTIHSASPIAAQLEAGLSLGL